MSRIEEPSEGAQLTSQLTRLQGRVVSLAATVLILGGAAALVSSPVDQALANLQQPCPLSSTGSGSGFAAIGLFRTSPLGGGPVTINFPSILRF